MEKEKEENDWSNSANIYFCTERNSKLIIKN